MLVTSSALPAVPALTAVVFLQDEPRKRKTELCVFVDVLLKAPSEERKIVTHGRGYMALPQALVHLDCGPIT